MREAIPVYDLPLYRRANPDVQEIIHKLDDLPDFDQVLSTLPVDPTGAFYDLLSTIQSIPCASYVVYCKTEQGLQTHKYGNRK